jgi:hypothetical protein
VNSRSVAREREAPAEPGSGQAGLFPRLGAPRGETERGEGIFLFCVRSLARQEARAPIFLRRFVGDGNALRSRGCGAADFIDHGITSFCYGNEDTEYLNQNLVPFSLALDALIFFVRTRERPSNIEWERL